MKKTNVNTNGIISPAQCRAARAFLQWSQEDLAEAAKVAKQTLADFERGARNPYARTLSDIRAALEAAGVCITADGCVCPPKPEEVPT